MNLNQFILTNLVLGLLFGFASISIYKWQGRQPIFNQMVQLQGFSIPIIQWAEALDESSSQKQTMTQTIDLNHIDELNIELGTTDLIIDSSTSLSNQAEFTIEFQWTQKNQIQAQENFLNIENQGRTLTIGLFHREKDKSATSEEKLLQQPLFPVIKNIPFNNAKLKISLPADWQKKLSAVSTSGDLRMKEINLTEVDIASKSGDFRLTGNQVKRIKMKTTSGDIRMEKMASDWTLIESTSGDLIFDDFQTQAAELKSTSGDIKGFASFDSLNAETVSGDIRLKIREIPEKTWLKSISGDVSIKTTELPKTLPELMSVSGSIFWYG